jgi:hypothetical protein
MATKTTAKRRVKQIRKAPSRTVENKRLAQTRAQIVFLLDARARHLLAKAGA